MNKRRLLYYVVWLKEKENTNETRNFNMYVIVLEADKTSSGSVLELFPILTVFTVLNRLSKAVATFNIFVVILQAQALVNM